MPHILLVDDHAVVRAGLRAVLESTNDPVTVEEASCFAEAMTKLRQRHWDAVILDLSLPGKSGLEVLKEIRRTDSRLPVLVLSFHSEREYGVRTLKAGASGYLDKSASREELLEATRRILAGRRYVSAELSECLVAEIAGEHYCDPHDILTDRELEVFRLISTGNSTAETARTLSISVKTAYSHRHNILKKLAGKSNADIVRYAYEHGLAKCLLYWEVCEYTAFSRCPPAMESVLGTLA